MTSKRVIWFLSGLCIALCLGFASRFLRTSGVKQPAGGRLPKGDFVYNFSPPPMGGVPMSIKAWNCDPMVFSQKAMESRALVDEIESEISSWRPESITTKLNKAKKGETIKLKERSLAVLQKTIEFYKETGGVFDPLAGPLIKLWKDGARKGKEPGPGEIEAAKKLCNIDAFHVDAAKKKCTKTCAGAQLDFGGIAKGYIVDKVVEYLEKNGVESGIVTAGGDLRVFGGKTSRKVGIRNPKGKANDLYGYFYFLKGGVATSGNYERSYKIGDKTYGHIIDPRTGRPVKGPLSVTVTGSDCTQADAFATAVYVLGRKKGLELAEKIKGIEAFILYDQAGEIKAVSTHGFPAVKDIRELSVSAETLYDR